MFEYYWIDLQEAAKKGRPLIKRISNTEADEDEDHRVKMKNPNFDIQIYDPGQVRGKDLNLGFRNNKGQNNAMEVTKMNLDLSLKKLSMFILICFVGYMILLMLTMSICPICIFGIQLMMNIQ